MTGSFSLSRASSSVERQVVRASFIEILKMQIQLWVVQTTAGEEKVSMIEYISGTHPCYLHEGYSDDFGYRR